jgi:hypothetical protein
LASGSKSETRLTSQPVRWSTRRVLNAIENGVDSKTTSGRMPREIIDGEQAEEVAEFVAAKAGEG